jgi:hypothetical protein
VKIGWRPALGVWWSAGWRGVLYGLVGGFVLGAIFGLIAGFVGKPEQAALYGAVGGYIVSVPATMLALKQALEKHLLALAAIARS